MPDLKIPVDEKFTIQFKKNGGKFIYCDSFDEVLEGLDAYRDQVRDYVDSAGTILSSLRRQALSIEARLEALASRSEMLLRLHPPSGGVLCACATWMARRAAAA